MWPAGGAHTAGKSDEPAPPIPPCPSDGQRDANSDHLILALNRAVKAHGYSLIFGDSQKNSKGVRNKIVLRCSRDKKTEAIDLTGDIILTVMPPPPSQLCSRPATQYNGEFTDSTIASTTPSTAGRKRRTDNNTTVNKKWARKSD